MIQLLLGRTAYAASLLLGIVISTFMLFHVAPTDPARTILGANASEAQVKSFRHELGLDRPLPVQFFQFTTRIVKLDFGRSYVDGRLIAPEVTEKLLISLVLVALTLAIAVFYVALVTLVEFFLQTRFTEYLDFFWVSMPSVFSGVIIGLLAIHHYPITSFSGRFQSWQDLLFFIPPAVALALYPMAILSRILRAEVQHISHALFITAARAAGHSEWQILFPRILKNTLVPVVSALSLQLPMLFAGAFIIEAIFSIPGIGTLLIRSLLQRDMPMLQAIVIVNGCVVLTGQFLIQVTVPMLDPRVRTNAPAKA